MHEVLQPGKDDGRPSGPFMHRFARDREGKLYVDGDA